MAVKNNLKFLFSSVGLNIQKAWRYKPAFFMNIFMMIANNLIVLIEYVVIYQFTTDIGGYSMGDAMVLMAICAGGFGLSGVFFAGIRDIHKTVYDGKLDVFLTQPKNALLSIGCSRTDISGFGDFLSGFLIMAIAGAPWHWYLLYIPIACVSAMLYVGVVATFSSICFWVKNGNVLSVCVENIMLNTTTFPPMIYNFATRLVLFTVVPALFMAFVPVQYVLRDFNIWWTLGFVGVTIFWLILGFLLFRLGLKRYNSGNIMSARM